MSIIFVRFFSTNIAFLLLYFGSFAMPTLILPKKYENIQLINNIKIEIIEFKLKLNIQLLFNILGIIDKNNPNIIENVNV